MTAAELNAYQGKRHRERPEREQLTRRYEAAWSWLETNFNSLTHWRRVVEQFEEQIRQFRDEEATLPPFEGSAFLRELVHENPVPWSAYSLRLAPVQHQTPQGEELPH
jgi:hypothetical protein